MSVLTQAAFLFGTALFFLFPYFPFSGLGLFLSASAFSLFKRKVFLVPLIAAGIIYAALRVTPGPDPRETSNRDLRIFGRFVPRQAAPSEPDLKIFASDAAFDPMSGKEIKELRGTEVRIFSDFIADYGRNYEIMVKTSGGGPRHSPGVMTSSRVSGILMSARPSGEAAFSLSREFDRYRAQINCYLLKRFREEPAALISAITTGEMSYLDEDLKNAFNVTGLAHILSISGTHFGLFSVMTFGVFLFLIRRLPYAVLQRLTIYLTPSQAAAILSMPLMAVYLGISGSSPPAVRSFVMVGIFLAGLLFGRKGFWLNSLLLAADLLVLWDPEVILSLSFQLSFLAVLFIGFSVEKKEGEHEEGNRFYRFVRSSVALTLTATVGTSVLVAYHFHYFSVVSPLSNLLIAPFMGFVLVPSAVLSSLWYLMTGSYILAPVVSLSAEISIMLVRLFARIPFADIRVPSFPPAVCILFYAGFLVYFFAGRRKKLLFLPFVPLLVYALVSFFDRKELTVTFLDVGQGDSEVIELPDGRTIVVDTGRTGKETAAFLRYRGRREIDALVLSHSHPDHSGGLAYLLHSFRVGQVWDNGRIIYPPELDLAGLRRGLGRGDRTETAGCSITVLHPYAGFYTPGNEYGDANESSLVMKVSGRTMSVLLPGDIGEEAERDVSHAGEFLRSDIIKIPHHGSRTSANDRFLELVSPSIAVISVGRDNAFGHPSPEVVEKLAGKKVLRTDTDGAVGIRETGNGPAVKTYNDFQLKRAAGPADEWSNMKKLFATW